MSSLNTLLAKYGDIWLSQSILGRLLMNESRYLATRGAQEKISRWLNCVFSQEGRQVSLIVVSGKDLGRLVIFI